MRHIYIVVGLYKSLLLIQFYNYKKSSFFTHKIFFVKAKPIKGFSDFDHHFCPLTLNANDIISDKELKMVAKLWLNALPPKKRAIFILHFQENLSTKEIALKLGISQKTVQNQLGTASNELRDKMIKLLILLATS